MSVICLLLIFIAWQINKNREEAAREFQAHKEKYPNDWHKRPQRR